MTASTIPSIGIDFGGTSIKMGVVKGAEVIAHAPSIATQEYGNPDQLIEAIAQFVNMLRLNHPEVQAIGMGMPGFVNFYQGTVYTLTNVPGWNNVPVKDMLQAACGLPVYVENDANCMAYAEWKLGAGRGMSSLVCLTMGTGIGGGIVVHDRMLRGRRLSAAELGQTSIHYQGKRDRSAAGEPLRNTSATTNWRRRRLNGMPGRESSRRWMNARPGIWTRLPGPDVL